MELDERITLAARIESARMRAGLSQAQLARRMGIERQSVQQWENGETAPRQSRLTKLAQVLGVNAQWLLTGEPGGQIEDVELGILSFEERKLLKLFRQLPMEQQMLLQSIALTMRRQLELLQQAEQGAGDRKYPQRPRIVHDNGGKRDKD